MKKLEIEKTKPTFIISTFKTDIIKVGLVFSISNIFIAKTSLANNWRSFSSSYLALGMYVLTLYSITYLCKYVTLLTVTVAVSFEVKNSPAKKIVDCCFFLTICPIDFDLAIDL